MEEATKVVKSIAVNNGKSLWATVSLILDDDEDNEIEPNDPFKRTLDIFRLHLTRMKMVLMTLI